MSELNDKLKEIRELLRMFCEENNIEFYSTYQEEDETPNEIVLNVWYTSRSSC